MALKFRLKGLAETFVDHITCSGCGLTSSDDEHFLTEMSKVTLEGIIVVAQCKACGEIFVPDTQRYGVLNYQDLREAVEKDCEQTGDPVLPGLSEVRLGVERLNAQRRDDLH